MFGLLRVPKGYLGEDEFKVFQAHYCGLCHALGRRGFQGLRLATSYDGTALAMFFSGLKGKELEVEQKLCLYSPWRKKPQASGSHEVFDFTALATLALVRLKGEDELLDGAKGPRRWAAAGLVRYLDKKVPDWPELEEVGAQQREAEQRKDPWFDELAYPSGLLLGSLAARAAASTDKDQQLAFKVGENLGKWIYIWDALWDFEGDCKRGRFNALKAAFRPEADKVTHLDAALWEEIDFILDRCKTEVLTGLSGLDLGQNGLILAKLIRGAHLWHKANFVKDFFNEEGVSYECLPSAWRPSACTQPASAGTGSGGADQQGPS